MPRVSVVVPAYNSAGFIASTVESVFSQTYPDYELIVVDDGSTDATAERLEPYAGRLTLVRQPNGGVSAARNNGIGHAGGEYIALLDHDDLWSADKLEKQVALLDGDRSLGLVYSDCDVVDSQGRVQHRYFERFTPHRGNVLAPLFVTNFIPCLTAVMRRSVLDEAGLFPTDLTISEEYDLFLRLAARSRFDYVDRPLATYRVHDSNVSHNTERMLNEALIVLGRAVRQFPEIARELGPKVEERLGQLTYDLGVTVFRKGRTRESRPHFLDSIRLHKANLPAYAYLAASFLPPGLAAFVVRGLKVLTGR